MCTYQAVPGIVVAVYHMWLHSTGDQTPFQTASGQNSRRPLLLGSANKHFIESESVSPKTHKSKAQIKTAVTLVCQQWSYCCLALSYGNDLILQAQSLQMMFTLPFMKDHLTFNTFMPRQNGRHFPNDIFLNENVPISLKISLRFVPRIRIFQLWFR